MVTDGGSWGGKWAIYFGVCHGVGRYIPHEENLT
jgi:hypothetical protein